MCFRHFSVVFLTSLVLLRADPPKAGVDPEVQAALDGIHASSLRDDLQFISSDELQGRDSPLPGLDRAADYIADQFRRAGLEPGVGDSYFQNAAMVVGEANYDNFALAISAGGKQYVAKRSEVVLSRPAALELENKPLFKIDLRDEAFVRRLAPADVEGKVVIFARDRRASEQFRAVSEILSRGKPALVILIDRAGMSVHGLRPRRLLDESATGSASEERSPRLTLTGDAAARFYAKLPAGSGDATATVHIAAPHRMPVTLRNVIGVLRGSDPALRDECVMLTAHYDHLGVKPEGSGDRIYNGANDDGSGTVSVMEVARALAHLPRHPRRSIVFMTFFGEEEGLIGSEYYAHHPVWPLDKTVADLNLEQVAGPIPPKGRRFPTRR